MRTAQEQSPMWPSAKEHPGVPQERFRFLRADQCGAMTIIFDDSSAALGTHITDDAFTAACQTHGDTQIVIGLAPNEKQAKKALREVRMGDGRLVLMDNLTDGDAVASARAARSARRSACRSR